MPQEFSWVKRKHSPGKSNAFFAKPENFADLCVCERTIPLLVLITIRLVLNLFQPVPKVLNL